MSLCSWCVCRTSELEPSGEICSRFLVFAILLFVHLNLSCIRLMASEKDDVTKLEVLGCEVYHGDVKTR